jgi:signal transduction histidine kinase
MNEAMKLSKQQEAEVIPIYNEWWHSYLNGDVKTYEHYLDDDYRFVGSTVAEDFLNKRDTTQFFDETADQLAGKTQKRNSKLTTEYYDGVVFITELADAYLLFGDEWTFYGKFRFSSMLRKRSDGWRFIYQHFSVPDSKAQEGETIGFEQVSKENQELRDAIKRRTAELENKNRELEIESALERIRLASMAMHSSEELASVARTVFEQLKVLGIDVYRSWIDIFHVTEGYVLTWSTDFEGNFQPNPATFPLDFDETMSDFYRDYKSPSKFIELEAHGDEVREWFDYLYSVSSDPIFKMTSVPDDLYQIWAKHSYGTVATTKLSPITENEKVILNRFAKVFEQAYTRFLDLQKAEAQAREAQIETALERVRSRTMAMQSSDELTEAATVMFSQIEGLGLNPWSCGFNIFNDDKTVISQWVSTGDGRPIEPFDTPATEGIFKRIVEQSENDEPLYIEKMEGKKLEDTYKYMASLPTLDKIFEELDAAGIELPKKQVDHAAYFKHGYLMFITYEETPEFHSIFKRFAKVFEQTYTRFLDLKKAEAQAREAQIEAALERIRSKAIAMQNTNDIADTVITFFEKLLSLGLDKTMRAGIGILSQEERMKFWTASVPDDSEVILHSGFLEMYRHPLLEGAKQAWADGNSYFDYVLEDEDIFNYYQSLNEAPDYPAEFDLQNLPDTVHHRSYVFKDGLLYTFSETELPDDISKTLERFAAVLGQTYTRYLDLERAEIQAREAKIETALERVRSRTMAMQHSDELIETSEMMFEQIKNLDIELWSCGFSLWYDDDSYFMGYNTGPDGKMGNPLKIPLTEDVFFTTIRDAKRRGDDFLVFESKGESLEETYSYMDTLPVVGEFMRGIVAAGAELPKYQVTHCGFFSHGHLMFIALEHNPEAIDIFKRFTKVFEQTYTRFLDLQKAEAQAREAQIEVAVERVRAKALAMHKSTEILQVAITLKEQMEGLNLSGVTAATIYLEHDDNKIRVWDITELKESENGPQLSSDFTFRLEDTDPDLWVRRVWNAREKYSVIEMSGNDFIKCEKWIREFDETTADNYREFIRAAKIEHTWHPTVQLEKGKLNLDFTVPPPLEMEFILPKMGAAFDLAYRRFLDLQKAERQTREAQIEASLERVRAKAMSMQNSDELDEVLSVLCEQFDVLGILPMSTHMTVFNFSNNTFTFRETGKYGDRSFGEQTVDLDAMDTWKETVDKWRADEATAVNKLHFPKETLPEVWEVFHESFASMPEESRITPDDYPDGIYHTAGKHPFGYIGMNQIRPATGEEEEIVIKFANEFGRAYQRFLDLQKAEAQAREAKIETALEKIRSRTMAMQKGEELQEVAVLLYKELIALGVTNFVTCGYVEVNEDIRRQHTWVTAPGGDTMGLFHLPLTGDATFDARYAAWKKQQPVFHQSVAGQVRSDHLEYAITTFNSKEAEEMVRSQFPDPTVFYCFNFSHGYLHLVGGSLLEKEEENLLARFTKVFEQTYTRFLDLQKAEEQAREAKIEMSLEKIRSRTMGMQSSDELPEVANMLFLEVQELGIPAWSCGYCILTEDRRASTCIMSSEGTIQKPFLLPHSGEPSFEEWDDFVHGDQTFFTQELKGEPIESHYNFMKSLPQLKPVFQDLVDAGLSLPDYQINHLCKFSHGFLLFITYEEVPGSHDIFKRFTSVFDQTYTRFLDLKKSEQRAREAEVDLSLERVRSQVTAMQASSDLFDIVVNMRKEFVSLGYTADYFWHMRWLPDVYEMSMTSEDGNRLGMVINVPKFVHDQIPGLAEWEKGSESTYVLALNAEEAWDYIDNMNKHGDYEVADPNAPAKEDIEHIGGLTFIIARTSHGEIGYSLPGMVPNPPKDAIDTLVRLAGVFDLAYKRFEDLQESEQQARLILEERDRLEITLKELHATQDQLIQQEKLASLGQLTAGIAHEIKNPLNFVNNFSEVSVELIEEAREEVRRVTEVRSERRETEDRGPGSEKEKSLRQPTEGKDPSADGEQGDDAISAKDETTSLLLEILDDIEANLRKIHEHGSRADGIVKSMLQHSRGGDGKMEPTPLNPIIKEYVNLAFHGMRAGKEPINVDIDLQLDENVGEVPLVAEDFSRVILNLTNNAFDAMRDKQGAGHKVQGASGPKAEEKSPFEGGKDGEAGQGDDAELKYSPKLSIRTKSDSGKVLIEIEDNGPGIPDDIKDKIMQPFFTTKKGTQGTGLGLSITNDIIKAHGGRMDVSSTPGEGSTFTIHLEKKG